MTNTNEEPINQSETSSENSTTADTPAAQALDSIASLECALEAILFAAGYPVKYTKLAEVLGLSPSDIRKLAEHMEPRYHDEKSNRGIQLLILPDTCQLCTKEEYTPYIREALGVRRGGNLSASSMETLAVIAYNQPVTRSFVDHVRGVDSSYAVTSLLDKGLIEAVGRLDAVGRPMLYGTTDKFLRVFGIRSLAELPETEALAVAAAQNEAAAKDADTASASSDETLTPSDKEEESEG